MFDTKIKPFLYGFLPVLHGQFIQSGIRGEPRDPRRWKEGKVKREIVMLVGWSPLGVFCCWTRHGLSGQGILTKYRGVERSWVRIPFKPEFFQALFLQLLKLRF